MISCNTDAQADYTGHGITVAQSNLQAGNLIFYATNLNNPSIIYHVAMYVGNGEMVKAYGAGILVWITLVHFKNYWGAKHFLTH